MIIDGMYLNELAHVLGWLATNIIYHDTQIAHRIINDVFR